MTGPEHGRDQLDTQRSAQVFYDRDTGRLVVRLEMTDDELPTEVEIAAVSVELVYPETSPNYGVRNFVPLSSPRRAQ